MSNNKKEELSFEQNIDKAQKYLEELIDPNITLSNSVEIYKKGIKELDNAQKQLNEAKLEFKEI